MGKLDKDNVKRAVYNHTYRIGTVLLVLL